MLGESLGAVIIIAFLYSLIAGFILEKLEWWLINHPILSIAISGAVVYSLTQNQFQTAIIGFSCGILGWLLGVFLADKIY